VVLVAHLDSHRAVFWFASDFLVRLFGPIGMMAILGIFLAIPEYLLAGLTDWPAFGWLGICLAGFHFLGWFTGVTADLGPYSPGANDNASSVGALLALAGRLAEQPLKNTEVWLAFTGCEESSGDGIQALMATYGNELKEAWFIDLEMVGIGDTLNYIREEGSLRRVTISQEMETLLKKVGQPYGLKADKTPLVGASTECSLLLDRGFNAARLIASRTGSTLMPEWHRMTDTPSKLQPAALERIQGLVWDILQRLDQ
ncbi:MAG: Zn-dependent exopeptidase M28, partial [Anaerolineae bacterium]|nr:Zn-dependent exopeptidase M28 [Anaerolineae bacterium]